MSVLNVEYKTVLFPLIADTNYNSTIKELLFNETVHQICLEVTILRDDIVTTDTHFFVQLSSEDHAVNLSHDTRVLIANTDGMCVHRCQVIVCH